MTTEYQNLEYFILDQKLNIINEATTKYQNVQYYILDQELNIKYMTRKYQDVNY